MFTFTNKYATQTSSAGGRSAIENALIQKELELPIEKRRVTGDASETGLVKFS